MTAVVLVERLSEATHTSLPPTLLDTHPTLDMIAAHLITLGVSLESVSMEDVSSESVGLEGVGLESLSSERVSVKDVRLESVGLESVRLGGVDRHGHHMETDRRVCGKGKGALTSWQRGKEERRAQFNATRRDQGTKDAALRCAKEGDVAGLRCVGVDR